MTIGFSDFIQSFRSDFLDIFFNGISFLGEELVYVIVICIIYYGINKRFGELLSMTLFTSLVFNTSVKGMFMVERPFQKYPDRILELRPTIGSSFPSAHTQGFTSFLFSIGFWLKKRGLLIIAGILSILMGLSRIYLGMHWLEDVTASIIFGIGIAYFMYRFFHKNLNNKNKLLFLYLCLLIAFFPFVILFKTEDLILTYSMLLGIVGAMYVEKTYVNFTMDISIWKKSLRIILGVISMVMVIVICKILFRNIAEDSLLAYITDGGKYGLMIFVAMGFFPLTFRKLKLH